MFDRSRAVDNTQLDLEASLLAVWPRQIWSETRILIAVSGGADSVALARAMTRLSDRRDLLELAHFNHGWRGAESDQDELFVRRLGDLLGLQVHAGRASDIGTQDITVSEETARNSRYEFLCSVAYLRGARYVLTAHTANDRVETILHNLFRGTGIAGINSLKLTRPLEEQLVLVRPMLRLKRANVLQYLEHLNQPFREDSSNADQSYRRNFLRYAVLPTIRRAYGSDADERLLAFSDILSDMDAMLCSLAREYLKQADELTDKRQTPGGCDNGLVRIPNNSLLPSHWPIVHRALKSIWLDRKWPLAKMNRKHWELIRQLHEPVADTKSMAGSGGWKVAGNLPGNLQVRTDGSWVAIKELR